MKKTLLLKTLLLLCVLIVGSTSAWADNSTLSFTKACGGSGTSDDGLAWTVSSDASESTFDSTSGIHYGTNNATVTYVTLTTTNLSTILSGKKITKIVVNARDAQSDATISVSVGSTNFTANSSNPSIENTSHDFTFDGEATIGSGDQVTVDVRRSSEMKKAIYVKSIVITYETAGPADNRTATATVINVPDGFKTDLANGTDVAAGTLTATVTPTGGTALSNPAIKWSSSETSVATINESTGAVTLKAVGSTTITAAYQGDDTYKPSSKNYVLDVVDTYAKGQINNPYTVAEAIAAIDDATGTTDIYVRGIVCEAGSSLSSGAMNYWISDDGTETDKLEIFKGKGLNGADFASENDVHVGDIVVVTGNLTKYSSTYEFSSGSEIVTISYKVAAPTFSPVAGAVAEGTEVTLSTTTEGATIYYTTDGSEPTKTSTPYNNTPITIDAAKTIKAFAVKEDYIDSEVATAAYTIIQAVRGYTIDFESPIDMYVDWTVSNIGIHTSGLTCGGHSGTKWGSNVNDNDNATTSAYLQTKEKVEYPGVFTCYISKESNNTTTSSWKIQVSSDGSTWDDIAELTSMTRNSWVKFEGDIKAKGYTNVYVRLYYSGSNAKRAVDDISLTSNIANIPANKEWITFCSTENLDFTSDIDGLEGAYTITAHADKATALTATKMTGKVKAGTGLLLRAAAVDATNPQVITIPVAATGDEQADNMLKGVTADTEVQPTAGDYTNLGLSNGEFHPYSAAGTLAAGKAYLQVPTAQMPTAGNNARLYIVLDGEATGINAIENSELRIENLDAPMYNLAGQRVTKSYKGVVIVNGKKVVRK